MRLSQSLEASIYVLPGGNVVLIPNVNAGIFLTILNVTPGSEILFIVGIASRSSILFQALIHNPLSGARTDGTFRLPPFPHRSGTVAWFFPRLSLMKMPAGGGAALNFQELDEKSSTRSANASHVSFLLSKPQPRVTQASFPLPFSPSSPTPHHPEL